MIGALSAVGMPEYEAKRCEGRVPQGGVLLSVHCDSSKENAASILVDSAVHAGVPAEYSSLRFGIILLWLAIGPLFGSSDTWQCGQHRHAGDHLPDGDFNSKHQARDPRAIHGFKFKAERNELVTLETFPAKKIEGGCQQFIFSASSITCPSRMYERRSPGF
jgi:hypothetical protein